MKITVKEFLNHAWDSKEYVALHDTTTEKQEAQFINIREAMTDGWKNWIVDMFSVDTGLFGRDKVIHLWVYPEGE